MSLRDGFECLWVQRLDPAAKTPPGAPFPVYHFHSARRSPAYVRPGQRAISMARDKIVFTMENTPAISGWRSWTTSDSSTTLSLPKRFRYPNG